MTPETVIDMRRKALMLTLFISAPPLSVALAVGPIVSILRAVTRIQEFTRIFIPKILAVFIATMIFLPWMLQVFLGYTKSPLLDLRPHG